MQTCCEEKESELTVLHQQQSHVLKVVLAINAIMFCAEGTAGIIGHSTALLADSLDMLGDAIVYAFSLYVVGRAPVWRVKAAMLKGLIMTAFGLGVLAEAARKAVLGTMPTVETMGVIGALALAANLACLILLFRHRGDDLNMRSTWLCSRNDIVGNVAVLLAAGLVAITGSNWPDILIGSGIALLFLSSGIGVLRESASHMRRQTRQSF